MMNDNSCRTRPRLCLPGFSNSVKVYRQWKCKKIRRIRRQNNLKAEGSKEKVWVEEESEKYCVFPKKHFWAFALLAGDNQDLLGFVHWPISSCSCLQPSSQALPHACRTRQFFYLRAEISDVCSPLERKFFWGGLSKNRSAQSTSAVYKSVLDPYQP